jgi:hypothetical protein
MYSAVLVTDINDDNTETHLHATLPTQLFYWQVV